MPCFAPMIWEDNEKPNGVCEDCGEDTVDGIAYDQCSHSPELCETCGHSPCDWSC